MPTHHASRSSRLRQSTVNVGLGKLYTSPRKPRNKLKTQTQATNRIHQELKKQSLYKRLYKLLQPPSSPSPLGPASTSNFDDSEWQDEIVLSEDIVDTSTLDSVNEELESQIPTCSTRRTVPNNANFSLYQSWQELLPTLMDSFLAYLSASVGTAVTPVKGDLEGQCKHPQRCITKTTLILCLYFDRESSSSYFFFLRMTILADFISISISSCDCWSISQVLIRNGLFPTAPTQPRMAVSIDLLDFYSALFERSCDAVNAMATALNSFYERRGYHLLNSKVRSRAAVFFLTHSISKGSDLSSTFSAWARIRNSVA